MTNEIDQYDNYTIAALEDELVLQLSSFFSCDSDEKTKSVRFTRKYLHNAKLLIYRINVFKPIPYYEISLSDLSENLKRALECLPSRSVDELVSRAVCRIIESADPSYYHINGLHGKIRWRFIN